MFITFIKRITIMVRFVSEFIFNADEIELKSFQLTEL